MLTWQSWKWIMGNSVMCGIFQDMGEGSQIVTHLLHLCVMDKCSKFSDIISVSGCNP